MKKIVVTDETKLVKAIADRVLYRISISQWTRRDVEIEIRKAIREHKAARP